MKRRGISRRIGYLAYLFVAVFILLEVILRIYNPFHLRLKGDKIVLPVDQRQIITNTINPKLDPVIVNTRNHLGFRGPELPASADDKRSPAANADGLRDSLLKIITIGGSTTECHFLNDDKTWPWLLGRRLADSCRNCWLNNAGLDGHSTYGHLVLLNGHVKYLRPSVVIFMTGINDVENNTPTFHDKLNTRGAFADLGHYLFENSEVLNLLLNLSRGWRAQRFNNTTGGMLVLDSTLTRRLPDTVMAGRLALQKPYLEAYRNRVRQLTDTCLKWGIEPVWVTQANLFGIGRDPVSGVDLELFPTDEKDNRMNGRLIWEVLEEYNQVVREVCAERAVPLIDLARRMPKDSRYFYDMSHFTNAGAEKVSEILDSGLRPVLDEKFRGWRK
jgi:lysophospholipase L1-like esterase